MSEDVLHDFLVVSPTTLPLSLLTAPDNWLNMVTRSSSVVQQSYHFLFVMAGVMLGSFSSNTHMCWKGRFLIVITSQISAKQKEKEEKEPIANGNVPSAKKGITKTSLNGKQRNEGPNHLPTSQNTVTLSNSVSKRQGVAKDVRFIRVPGMTWQQAG